MSTADLRPLLGAVRRRLWTGRLVAAARHALWGTAALVLALAVVHAAWRPVDHAAAVAVALVPWLIALARAAAQRPGDGACALWADRRLGGESAFTTLLEARHRRGAATDARALAWLEQWAARRLPAALDALNQRPLDARLARPAAAAAVCVALAALVLSLPGRQVPAGETVTADAGPAVATPASTPVLDAQPLVDEVASALRPPPGRDGARRRDGPRGGDRNGDRDGEGPGDSAPANEASPPANARGQGDDRERAGARQAGAAARGDDSAARVATSEPPAASVERTAGTTGGSTGREAGTSRDTRTNTGVSTGPQGTMPSRRVGLAAAPRAGTAAAGETEGAAVFDDATANGRPPAGSTALAIQPAAPPPARPEQALTPAQTRYVQAWITARGTR